MPIFKLQILEVVTVGPGIDIYWSSSSNFSFCTTSIKLAYEQVIVVFKIHFPRTEFYKELTGRKYFLLLTVVIRRTHAHTQSWRSTWRPSCPTETAIQFPQARQKEALSSRNKMTPLVKRKKTELFGLQMTLQNMTGSFRKVAFGPHCLQHNVRISCLNALFFLYSLFLIKLWYHD